jgi:hypothetical protein
MIAGASPLLAQELEPRLLTNVPVGSNFALAGYGFASGNLLLDPAVPIEGLNSNLHTFVGAYIRSIDVFGLAGKVDAVLPFALGDWTGEFGGQDSSRSIDGFGDPRVRMSVNFVGSPALGKDSWADWEQRTIVGASLQLVMPLGQYDPSRLINLGSNRWTFRPQVGLSHAMGLWILEGAVAAWLFTDNQDFFGGLELEQRPLFTFKSHLIRSLSGGWWLSLGAGYGTGGRTLVEGIERDTHISTFRFSGTLAAPLGRGHTLKLVLTSGVRQERGPDFDAVAITYQYLWGS